MERSVDQMGAWGVKRLCIIVLRVLLRTNMEKKRKMLGLSMGHMGTGQNQEINVVIMLERGDLFEGCLSKKVSSIPCEKIPVARACSSHVSLSQWTSKNALAKEEEFGQTLLIWYLIHHPT